MQERVLVAATRWRNPFALGHFDVRVDRSGLMSPSFWSRLDCVRVRDSSLFGYLTAFVRRSMADGSACNWIWTSGCYRVLAGSVLEGVVVRPIRLHVR